MRSQSCVLVALYPGKRPGYEASVLAVRLILESLGTRLADYSLIPRLPHSGTQTLKMCNTYSHSGGAWERATVEISDCVQTPSKPTFSVILTDIMHHNEEHSFLAIPTVDWEYSLQKYKSVD